MKRSLRPRVVVNFAMTVNGQIIPNSEIFRLLADGDVISSRLFKEFSQGKISLSTLLEILRSRWGVKKLVCEGGPSFLKSLLEIDAVDELCLTIAPILLGGREAISMTGLPKGFLPEERRFRLKSLKQHQGEARFHYLRDRKK